MVSVTTEELSQLAQPFNGESPVGTDPRANDEWDAPLRLLKDTRDEALAIERNDPDSVDAIHKWRKTREFAQQILHDQAKDLEVASYLAEALPRLDGFDGLYAGAALLNQLVEHFWAEIDQAPDLFPNTSVKDLVKTRLTKFANERTVERIGRVVFTQGEGAKAPFAAMHYRDAQDLGVLEEEERATRISNGYATVAEITEAVRETDDSFLQSTFAAITQSRKELQKLSNAIEIRCEAAGIRAKADDPAGEDAVLVEVDGKVVFEKLIKELGAIGKIVESLAGDRVNPPEAATDTESESEDAGNETNDSHAAQHTAASDEIHSRQDAFRLLQKVADFFELTEPQSLLPVQLHKVIKRGEMSPRELLEELVRDSGAKTQVFDDLGFGVDGTSGDGQPPQASS